MNLPTQFHTMRNLYWDLIFLFLEVFAPILPHIKIILFTYLTHFYTKILPKLACRDVQKHFIQKLSPKSKKYDFLEKKFSLWLALAQWWFLWTPQCLIFSKSAWYTKFISVFEFHISLIVNSWLSFQIFFWMNVRWNVFLIFCLG